MLRLARKKSGAEHSAPRLGKDGKKYPAKPRPASSSADEGARQFTALVLRLVLMIQGQTPQRYIGAGAFADDLSAVALFLGEVAAAEAASGKLKAVG
jgi:hypothetical protein